MEKSAELIQTIINKIPWLLWPVLILLFLWGLLLILKQLYGLRHQVRKNYITELKEHLNFKEAVINDISVQNAQLANQNYELREEANRKDEIINATVENAISIISEKELALEKLKDDNDLIIRQLKHALGTALWVTEREMLMRRMFLSLLTKSTVPTDIDSFLSKNIGSIITMMMSDDQIWNQEVDQGVVSDYFESRATVLSPHYLQLPITEEISLFANLRNELMELPSFIDTKVAVDNKNSKAEGAALES